MIQSILGTSSPDCGLVIQSTHWYTLWVGHDYPSDLTHYASPSHYIWITTFMAFIPISTKSSSTGTPTVAIIDTNIYGSQAPCMLPILPWLVRTHINFKVGIFTTGIVLSASILSFVNRPTGRWSSTSLNISDCDTKYTYVDALSASLSLHDYMALLYRDSISHSHKIFYGRFHINNWYCTNLDIQMCTTCVKLASDSKRIVVDYNLTVPVIMSPINTS